MPTLCKQNNEIPSDAAHPNAHAIAKSHNSNPSSYYTFLMCLGECKNNDLGLQKSCKLIFADCLT